MNATKSLWSEFSLSTGIATLVCYAGIFGDVIGVEEMASRLGVSGQNEFYSALNELHLQGRLILKDGFAGLPHLEDKATIKVSKIATTNHLIDSRIGCLSKLGKSSIIKFVGISGSLAASNPTRDRNNHLDIDIFLITRNQCLWIFNILRGLQNLFLRNKQEPEVCINYVMDESNLLIDSRNFYTATEIRNLIPVSGLDAYRNFLRVNKWADYYYPGLSGASSPVAVTPSKNLINKFFYLLYTMLRSIKWLSIDSLKKISFRTDSRRGIGFNLFRPQSGGYQVMVQKKFSRLAETWFPELLPAELIEKLFPDELSAEIRRGNIDEVSLLGVNFGKYG